MTRKNSQNFDLKVKHKFKIEDRCQRTRENVTLCGVACNSRNNFAFCVWCSDSNFVALKGFNLMNNTIGSQQRLFLRLALVGLEGDLEDPVTKRISIETLNSDQGFIIVCHGDKTKSFTFVGLQVSDDLDVLNSSKGSK